MVRLLPLHMMAALYLKIFIICLVMKMILSLELLFIEAWWERSKEFGSIELLSSVDEYDEIFLIKRLEEMGVIDDKNKISFQKLSFSPWPITFQQGYKYQCKQVEDEIKSKFKNVILMNSNPINSSIMQTPTLTHRLQSEILK